MTRQLIVRRRAEQHIQSAYEWYEGRRPGLGGDFLTPLREKLDVLREYPESNRIVYRDVRRAVMSPFPYLIFYLVTSTSVTVLAVLHHARSPAAWPGR